MVNTLLIVYWIKLTDYIQYQPIIITPSTGLSSLFMVVLWSWGLFAVIRASHSSVVGLLLAGEIVVVLLNVSIEGSVRCCTFDLVVVGGVEAVLVVLVDGVGLNEVLLNVDVGFGVKIVVSWIVVALVIVVDFIAVVNVVFDVVFIEEVGLGISRKKVIKE